MRKILRVKPKGQMVDIDPKEQKGKPDVHLKIVSDAGRFLSCLIELLTEENQIDSEWLDRCHNFATATQ